MKESNTGLVAPNLWDLAMDRQRMAEEHPLQVARCTKIRPANPGATESACDVNPTGAAQGQKGADEQDKYVIHIKQITKFVVVQDKYVINIKQITKFVVGLRERVAPADIKEGMQVGYVV